MSTQYALVTGANKGIGLEIVRQLAEQDYHVFLAARDAANGQAAVASLASDKVTFVQLDVTDPASIEHAKQQILAVTDRLDLLINNAGIALDFGQPPITVDVNVLRQIFDVNYFGTFQVTQTFYPLVGNGKIINVTTDMSSQTSFDEGRIHPLNVLGYNSSKTALNAITLSLGKQFQDNGPEIFGVTPGFTSTDLNGNAPGGKTTAEGAAVIVRYALEETNYNGKILNAQGIMPW
ncbi:SDR family NAD(P)-dependent oxidoreductase [Exiguobacterium sp. RIT594]|uniref:SDR family NAD(P)-dependent oxidoreductase n=1 Tax=Exiguobacterium sp. RIT594 TaxID=2282449 RepID=UPI000DF79937|nr:SDR family NAD(P)-dependent oxidoreductase [Exiguobacterium sp. RIT594]RDB34293.1 SDR family NAD(P)-dependent oxidoreductase [Exiguobacterium sp. RIT594]